MGSEVAKLKTQLCDPPNLQQSLGSGVRDPSVVAVTRGPVCARAGAALRALRDGGDGRKVG
eukprot:6029491-Alexandrium_andersonii.AAC.1